MTSPQRGNKCLMEKFNDAVKKQNFLQDVDIKIKFIVYLDF